MGIKYSVNEKFFRRWSPAMAYLLGYIYADGNLLHDKWSRGKYVSVTSIDKELIVLTKELLNSEHKISIEICEGNRKDRFTLRIGNADLYNSLIELGLYPNKSLTISMPDVPKKFFKDFVRGYFDGDGCVHIYKSKGKVQKIILRKLCIIFSSGSKKFLAGLLILLRRELSLRQNKIYKGQRCWQLRFATVDSVELFKFMYAGNKGPFLSRKLNVFREYFELRPKRIDKRVGNVLGLGSGHVVK